MTDIAIIGAGLSGLTAATLLHDQANVTLFEKARGVGGRMATRRAAPYLFDFGAQFFTAKTPEFQQFLEPIINLGIIQRWDARFVEFVNDQIISQRTWDSSYPHYVGVPGMNAIAKHLSGNLSVKLNTKITGLTKKYHKWSLFDAHNNNLGNYDWVISAIPSHQAIELLPANIVSYDKISANKMQGCFSLMLGFAEPLDLEFDAAIVREADISWISVNSAKPARKSLYTLLVHSTNNWAEQHLDQEHPEIIEYLCQQTSRVIGTDVGIADHKALHCWRFANIEKQQGKQYIIDKFEQLAVAGDWLIQGIAEAAFISGFGLAKKLSEVITV